MWNRWAEWLRDGPPPVYPSSVEKAGGVGSGSPDAAAGAVAVGPGPGARKGSSRDLLRHLKPTVEALRVAQALPLEVTDSGGGVTVAPVRGLASLGAANPPRAVALAQGTRALAAALARAALGPVHVSRTAGGLPPGLAAALDARVAEIFGLAPDDADADTGADTKADAYAGAGEGTPLLQELAGAVGREYFGSSLALADVVAPLDGCPDLVVGSPGFGTKGQAQRGRVQVFAGLCDGASRDGSGNSVAGVGSFAAAASEDLQGPVDLHARLGASVAVGDLDCDGLDDIAVGGPTSGSLDVGAAVGNYSGLVQLRLSSLQGGTGQGQDQGAPVVVTVASAVTWANFGASVAVGDVNLDGFDDLVVGAPLAGQEDDAGGDDGVVGGGADVRSAGRVFVFLGPLNRTSRLTSDDADVELKGSSDFGWFGARVAVAEGAGLLLASAPSHRKAGTNGSVGLLSCFNFSLSSAAAVPTGGASSPPPPLAWSVEGDAWMGQAGLGFAVQALKAEAAAAAPLVAISSPTLDMGPGRLQKHAGQVVVVALDTLATAAAAAAAAAAAPSAASASATANAAPPAMGWGELRGLPGAVTLNGTEAFGRLGWELAFVDGAALGDRPLGLLLAAAPFAERERGAVYAFSVAAGGQGAAGTAAHRAVHPPRSAAAAGSRFGAASLVGLGDGRFLAGAPRRTAADADGLDMQGAVYLLRAPREAALGAELRAKE